MWSARNSPEWLCPCDKERWGVHGARDVRNLLMVPFADRGNTHD